MIEVEKRYVLNSSNEKRLIKGATLIEDKQVEDIYFDDVNFSLTTKNIWLRKRDGHWELKIPVLGRGVGKDMISRYQEIETEDEIKQALKIKSNKTLSVSLKELGFVSFADIVTQRKKYKLDDFIIDIDRSDFGYEVGEIELLVKNESEVEEAAERIEKFADDRGIKMKTIRGKPFQYIKLFSPKHYQALLDEGVM